MIIYAQLYSVLIIMYADSEKILLSTASGFLDIAQRQNGNEEKYVNCMSMNDNLISLHVLS